MPSEGQAPGTDPASDINQGSFPPNDNGGHDSGFHGGELPGGASVATPAPLAPTPEPADESEAAQSE